MDHQDWTPIVLKKTKPNNNKISNTTNSNYTNNTNNTNLDENIKIKKVSKIMAKQITDGRISKKMSQQDLANQTCIDIKMIKEIENAKCIYNADHINKISKIIGIKIDRKLDIINKNI